jgi:predicted Fe-S protein YdhL (DUF1289 family)
MTTLREVMEWFDKNDDDQEVVIANEYSQRVRAIRQANSEMEQLDTAATKLASKKGASTRLAK